jgi:hypothetical protein
MIRHDHEIMQIAKLSLEKQIHMIVGNYSTHKHAEVKHWLSRHPRYHIHCTPTGCSPHVYPPKGERRVCYDPDTMTFTGGSVNSKFSHGADDMICGISSLSDIEPAMIAVKLSRKTYVRAVTLMVILMGVSVVAQAAEDCSTRSYQEKHGKSNVVKACTDPTGAKSIRWQVTLLSPHSKKATALSAVALYNLPPMMTNGEFVVTSAAASFRPFDATQTEHAFTIQPSQVKLKKLGKDDYAIAFTDPAEVKGFYLLLLPNDPDGSPCSRCKGNGDWFEKKNSLQVHSEINAIADAMANFDSTYRNIAAGTEHAEKSPNP